jgi:hypothetical protein
MTPLTGSPRPNPRRSRIITSVPASGGIQGGSNGDGGRCHDDHWYDGEGRDRDHWHNGPYDERWQGDQHWQGGNPGGHWQGGNPGGQDHRH